MSISRSLLYGAALVAAMAVPAFAQGQSYNSYSSPAYNPAVPAYSSSSMGNDQVAEMPGMINPLWQGQNFSETGGLPPSGAFLTPSERSR